MRGHTQSKCSKLFWENAGSTCKMQLLELRLGPCAYQCVWGCPTPTLFHTSTPLFLTPDVPAVHVLKVHNFWVALPRHLTARQHYGELAQHLLV